MLTLFVISCTNNNYEKLVDEKFKKSKYEDILEIYDELYSNFSTLCELLDFKLYY